RFSSEVSLPLYWSGDGKPLRPTQGLKNRSIFPEGALAYPRDGEAVPDGDKHGFQPRIPGQGFVEPADGLRAGPPVRFIANPSSPERVVRADDRTGAGQTD